MTQYRIRAKPLTDLRVRMTVEILKFIRLIKVGSWVNSQAYTVDRSISISTE